MTLTVQFVRRHAVVCVFAGVLLIGGEAALAASGVAQADRFGKGPWETGDPAPFKIVATSAVLGLVTYRLVLVALVRIVRGRPAGGLAHIARVTAWSRLAGLATVLDLFAFQSPTSAYADVTSLQTMAYVVGDAVVGIVVATFIGTLSKRT